MNKTTLEKRPLVSVIVPTFNRPGMLVNALKSIENQTYRPLEIIVVNDAGESVESLVASAQREGLVTYIRHHKNKGLAASRNTGLRMAQGRYIAYLDDDDLFFPDHLETLVGFLENSDFKVAYTDAYCAHQVKQGDKYRVTHRELIFSVDFDYERILYQNFVPVLCFMHEKACIERIGNFDEGLSRHEDWDMWIRMSLTYKIGHIKKITCEYTSRTDGSSMSSGRAAEFRSTCERIFEKYKDDSDGKGRILEGQAAMRSLLRAKEALELAHEGNLAGAIDLLEGCLEFDPHNAQTHTFLGQLYTVGSGRDKAIAHFEKAVELCGSNPTYRKNLENALARFYPEKKIR